MKWTTTLLLLCTLSISNAEIVRERGTLSGFVSGVSPNSSYDNWLSHVTEGIADEGFNDYGPDWLDVQTNGFGTYKRLDEGSTTLDYWNSIFTGFAIGDLSLIHISEPTRPY